jgi:hypothetical protein
MALPAVSGQASPPGAALTYGASKAAPADRPAAPATSLAVGFERLERSLHREGRGAAAGATAAELRAWAKRLDPVHDASLRACIGALLADWTRATGGAPRIDREQALAWFASRQAAHGGTSRALAGLEPAFNRLGLLRVAPGGRREIDAAALGRLLDSPELAGHPAARWLGDRLGVSRSGG